MLAISVQSRLQIIGIDEMRVNIRQTKLRRMVGAITARAQHEHRHNILAKRLRVNALIGMRVGKPASFTRQPRPVFQKLQQHFHLLGKHFRRPRFRAGLQSRCRARVTAGCAAKAKVNAFGCQRVQHAKNFRDFHWAVMRQHNAARPNP